MKYIETVLLRIIAVHWFEINGLKLLKIDRLLNFKT